MTEEWAEELQSRLIAFRKEKLDTSTKQLNSKHIFDNGDIVIMSRTLPTTKDELKKKLGHIGKIKMLTFADDFMRVSVFYPVRFLLIPLQIPQQIALFAKEKGLAISSEFSFGDDGGPQDNMETVDLDEEEDRLFAMALE